MNNGIKSRHRRPGSVFRQSNQKTPTLDDFPPMSDPDLEIQMPPK